MFRLGPRATVIALGLTVACASFAAAQAVGTATIAGTVTDSSGAAVPGVTVEASSPALIEGTRSAVTNDVGRYSIVNLRPGVYTVTFTLPGFRSTRQENVQLTSDLTVTTNAQLTVGGVEEVVTVEAAATVVDTQAVALARVTTRDMIDALPTGRSPAALMNTIPGVTPGAFASSFRGTADSLTMVDGMRATNLIGAGPSLTTAPGNSNMYQEFSFSTNIDSAEVGQSGLRINLVPRDGGNDFRGTVFTTYTRGNWQSSNIDDELRAYGLNDPAKTLKLWDVNPSVGGPIQRDRLWFQTTYQNSGSETQVTGNYFDADPRLHVYAPDLNRPAVNSNSGYSFVQRLTWQVTGNDKIAGYYNRGYTETPYFYSPNNFTNPPPEAAYVLDSGPNDQGGGRWTRTHTSRLLFEGSYLWTESNIINNLRGDGDPWSARNVITPGIPPVPPAQYAYLETSSNRLVGAANGTDANFSRSWEARGAATYVTGSHSLKAGFSFLRGSYNRPTNVIGNVLFRLNSGVASTATLSLPTNRLDHVDGDMALYVQDRWTMRRLTVNAGLRFDSLKTSYPDQVLPASVWLASTTFPGDDVLDWRDLSPRLGLSYDLFGNGKTALKFAYSRFVEGQTINLTGAVNPSLAIATTDQRNWIDRNGDFTIYNADGSVQADELGPTTNANFGRLVRNTNYDPDVLQGWFKRGYTWETNAAVQHELIPRLAVTALYYRRTDGNVRATDNRAISPANYDGPFCITSPTDARLPGGGGEQVCGLFDIQPAARALSDNYVTFAETLGVNRPTTVTGYEISLNARLPGGAFVQGGFNFQNISGNTCDVIDNPEIRFCETNSSYRPDFSMTGAYMLPYEVQISGVYQGFAGPQVTAGWPAPSLAFVNTGLGRTLSAGASATKTIALVESGTEFLPIRHVFDMRFTKLFNVQRYRFQAMFDFYNIFNTNSVSSINTTFGNNPATRVWLDPTGVTAPRQFRLSAQFDF